MVFFNVALSVLLKETGALHSLKRTVLPALEKMWKGRCPLSLPLLLPPPFLQLMKKKLESLEFV